MCGRFTLRTPAPQLMELFRAPQFPTLFPRYNIAPTQRVLIVRLQSESGSAASPRPHDALHAKWGLIPFWAKDPSIGNRMINARSETVAEKPAFRQAFKKRRCLIPADGFYEWQTLGPRQKQPWLIHQADFAPFAMAGLWECWKPPGAAEPQDSAEPSAAEHDFLISCTILTTHANSDMQPLHDRMPVILQPHQYETWLSDDSSPQQRLDLLQPLPDGILSRYPVSTLVNKPGNDSEECVEPLAN